MKPTIVLIGRPNVGKSTLFNRLTKSRDALVADEPGVTRDRHYGHGKLGNKPYWVVDTGGFDTSPRNVLLHQSWQQTLQAVDEADAIVFLFDAREGVTAQDKVLANQLRGKKALLFLAVNKAEGMEDATVAAEFYELGLGRPYAISAAHGDHISEFIALILDNFPEDCAVDVIEKHPILSIVGRPNVGKSTLVNRILGETRVIALDQPGTTRDSISIDFTHRGKPYTIIDTAGIRRKSRIDQSLEKFSMIKALRAIEKANVTLLILDAKQDIADQDSVIAGLALEEGRALVIAINKWDDVEETNKNRIRQMVAQKLNFLSFAKFHYISALQGLGITELLRSVDEAYLAANLKLSTPKLTKVLINAIKIQAPPRIGFRVPKPRYAHQGGSNPPTIIIHGNALRHISASYTRFLENRFRQAFHLSGTPLRIQYKSSINPYVQRTIKK